MKNRVSKDLQLNLFITVLIGVLNFIVNRYFIKYMGIDMLGLMKLFTQLVAYLNLVDLGISSASSYALYKPLLDKDKDKISLIISTIDSFYKKIAIIIMLVGIILSLFIPYFIKIDIYGNNIYIYWILYVINTSLGYTFAKYPILFTANQEYRFVRKVQGLGKIIVQIIQIIFLIKVQSFILFVSIMILENFYNIYFYKKHYEKEYSYIKKLKEKETKILKDMKNIFWHKIGTLVVHNTDYIILSKFVSLKIVGIYSSYLIIYQMLITLINILTPVLTPKIGTFIVKNNKNNIYIYWRELYSVYVFLGTLIIICTYNLIFPFIKLWLGKEFLLPKLTIVLILANLFIHLIRGITDTFKNSCGFFDDTYVPALESVINLIFSLLLVQKIGLNGVIIGTLLSNIIVILLLKPILVFRRCFDKKAYEYIIDLCKLLTLFMMSFFTVNIIIKKLDINFMDTSSWNELILNAILLVAISVLVVLINFILDGYFRSIVFKIIKIEKNFKRFNG